MLIVSTHGNLPVICRIYLKWTLSEYFVSSFNHAPLQSGVNSVCFNYFLYEFQLYTFHDRTNEKDYRCSSANNVFKADHVYNIAGLLRFCAVKTSRSCIDRSHRILCITSCLHRHKSNQCWRCILTSTALYGGSSANLI